MDLVRRRLLAAGLGTGLTATAGAVAAAGPRQSTSNHWDDATGSRLQSASGSDQTRILQSLIDQSALKGEPLYLPPGHFSCARLTLRTGTRLIGAAGATHLELSSRAALITGNDVSDVLLEGLLLDGAGIRAAGDAAGGLVHFTAGRNVVIKACDIRRGHGTGIALEACSGAVTDCRISDMHGAAIFSRDAAGLQIAHNDVIRCSDNGILVWRHAAGEDGTLVASNRITGIAATTGGSGQYGNGINVFRAGNVIVTGNRISDCAYSAVRSNAASNIQMIANNCSRSGEVALYVEFAFEGALIANNIVDGAATGVAVTNFDLGGRLAIVEGNLIRNLVRRTKEPLDKRGDGIAVEADCVVSGNIVEEAAGAGIAVGWGKYQRNVIVSQNLVRNAEAGILLSSDPDAGACLITANVFSGTRQGGIRAAHYATPHGPDLVQHAPPNGRWIVTQNMTV